MLLAWLLLFSFLPIFPFSLPPPPGLEFPWGPKPFAEVVAGPLLRNNRQTTDSSSLEGHYVGVYFSAHWVSAEENKDKEAPWFLCLFPWPRISVKTQRRGGGGGGGRIEGSGSGAQQEEAEQLVKTDKREERGGGGDPIVSVCLHYRRLTLPVHPLTTTSGPFLQSWHQSPPTPLTSSSIVSLSVLWTCWYPARVMTRWCMRGAASSADCWWWDAVQAHRGQSARQLPEPPQPGSPALQSGDAWRLAPAPDPHQIE